jgi:hypothetical protein
MTSRARARQSCYSKLFRGREDVYGIRKRFKSDEWGYVPSTIRHWKAVLSADAALRKKVDQKTRKWLPLTDEVLRQHLEGKQAVFIRCSWTKPAVNWAYRRRLNDDVRATGAMSRFSSSALCRRVRRDNSGI